MGSDFGLSSSVSSLQFELSILFFFFSFAACFYHFLVCFFPLFLSVCFLAFLAPVNSLYLSPFSPNCYFSCYFIALQFLIHNPGHLKDTSKS